MNASVEHAIRNPTRGLSAFELSRLLMGDAFDPSEWPHVIED